MAFITPKFQCALWQATLLLLTFSVVTQCSNCPLEFTKLTMQSVAAGAKPYILGGQQQPNCTRCREDTKWTNFCSFKLENIPDMEACTQEQQATLLDMYLRRNWTEFLTWSPCELWPQLSAHTTWLMGDSQTQGLFRAVACFMMEFWDTEPYVPDVLPEVLKEFSAIIPPSCITLVQGLARVCYVRIDYGQDLYGRILPLWDKFGSTNDVLVVNFGQHWHTTYEGNLTLFVDYVKEHAAQLPGLIMWQEMLQTHPGGLSQSQQYAVSQQYCHPIPGTLLLDDGRVAVFEVGRDAYLMGGTRGKVSKAFMEAAGFPIVTSFNESLPLWWLHSDGGKQWPCVHYCHPAAYQTSAYMLFKALSIHQKIPSRSSNALSA